MNRPRRIPRLRLLLPFGALLLATAAPMLASTSSAEPVEPVEHSATWRYGPVTLPPAVGSQPGVFSAVVPNLPMACSNCYMTGSAIDLVFDDGSSANLDKGVMLHHVVVFNSGRPDPTCAPDTPIGALGERFFASGNERTPGKLPPGYGYHLGDESVTAMVELMNHTPVPQVVFVEADVTWVRDSNPGMKPVQPVWLDVANCHTSEYTVPAGASHTEWSWPSTLTGRVVAAGGHVHDGGTKMVLSNGTTGEQMCTSYAGYGNNPAYAGSVESMSTCIWDRIGTVRAGEALTIDTHYNVAEETGGVMGILLAYVYETDDLGGGSPPPAGVQAPEPASSGRAHPGHHH